MAIINPQQLQTEPLTEWYAFIPSLVPDKYPKEYFQNEQDDKVTIAACVELFCFKSTEYEEMVEAVRDFFVQTIFDNGNIAPFFTHVWSRVPDQVKELILIQQNDPEFDSLKKLFFEKYKITLLKEYAYQPHGKSRVLPNCWNLMNSFRTVLNINFDMERKITQVHTCIKWLLCFSNTPNSQLFRNWYNSLMENSRAELMQKIDQLEEGQFVYEEQEDTLQEPFPTQQQERIKKIHKRLVKDGITDDGIRTVIRRIIEKNALQLPRHKYPGVNGVTARLLYEVISKAKLRKPNANSIQDARRIINHLKRNAALENYLSNYEYLLQLTIEHVD